MSWEPPFSTGTESAEPAGLRRLLRLPSVRLNLMLVVAAIGAGALLVPRSQDTDSLPAVDGATYPSSSIPSALASELATPDPLLGTPVSVGAATPIPGAEAEAPSREEDAVYTIYLYKLPGLAPDAPPGTTLDVWVTWKPPLTAQPKVQLLLEGVRLARIETGFEEGPVADLVLNERDIPDLIYGERFGSMNAVTHPL